MFSTPKLETMLYGTQCLFFFLRFVASQLHTAITAPFWPQKWLA
jgi:hypothetical protein